MTEGETKAPATTPSDADFRRRDEALERQIEQDEAAETPKPPKLDHAPDGGLI